MIKGMKRFGVSLAAVLAVVLGGSMFSPAQAVTNPGKVYVQVRADLSQSNMLFSFQNIYTGVISQAYVGEGQNMGETDGAVPNNGYSTSEPQRMWVNPGWCAGWRYLSFQRNNLDAIPYSPGWNYIRGGANGVSVGVNPGGSYPPEYLYKIEAYLVPAGVAGCVG